MKVLFVYFITCFAAFTTACKVVKSQLLQMCKGLDVSNRPKAHCVQVSRREKYHNACFLSLRPQ